MWNGLKGPLVCGLVMSVAAILLIALQARKTAYDKKQNATYQFVGEKSLKAADDVIIISSQDFIRGVKARVAPPNGNLLSGGVDPVRIVRRSVEAAVPQNFRTPIELSAKLTEGINKQKNDWLKISQDTFDKALVENDAYERLKNRALRELDKNVSGNKVDVESILKNKKSESPVTTALKADKEISRKKDVPHSVAGHLVEDYYENKKVSLTELSSDISETEESFQKIVAAVNAELDEQVTKPKEDSSAHAVGFLAAPSGPQNPTLALILDEKQGLVGLYWLARVALTGIILFAFLYLVLIPLKHLFFWTASGEVLTEYTKKLLEAKTSAVGPTAARAAMVTVAAATIAGSAALAANGLPFTEPSEKLTPASIEAAVNKGRNGNSSELQQVIKKDSGAIPNLEEEIAELATKVGELELAIRGIPPSQTINNTDRELADAVQNLIKNGFGEPSANEPSTIFSSLSGLRANQANFETAMNGRLKTMGDIIGNRTDLGTAATPTLFGKVNHVLDTIGSRQNLNANTTGANGVEPTVIESLRGLGTSTSTGPNTLFGRTKSMQEAVDKASDAALAIRRDQLGTSGQNLFTQSKTLFSSERYRISRSAFDEIARHFGSNDLIRNKLERLISEDKIYSEDELRVAMGPLLPGVWDNAKQHILRYARVARF